MGKVSVYDVFQVQALLKALSDRTTYLEGMQGVSANSPDDSKLASFISNTESQSRKKLDLIYRDALPIQSFGVVGDGVTDDTTAFKTAIKAAADSGLPLVIPRKLVIGIAASITFPEGLRLYTNGAKFKALVPLGRAPLFSVKSFSNIEGRLRIETLGGEACQGVTLSDVWHTYIDGIEVDSVAVAAGSKNIRDNGVRLDRTNYVEIGFIKVKNYDWSVWLGASTKLTVGWIEAEVYAKAVHLVDLKHSRINGGHVYGKSPNSKFAPGYNGLLSEVDTITNNLIVSGFTVEDAGEHGYRISGPYPHDRVTLENCTAIRSGGSGFKVLDDIGDGSIRNRSVTLTDCEAIDSGLTNRNCCGFLIQMVDGCNLTNLSVKKDQQAYSAVEGVRLSGVKHLRANGIRVRDSHKFALHIDEQFGDIRDLKVKGIDIDTSSGHGIYVQNPGINIWNLELEGFVENTAPDGTCLYIGRYLSATETGSWSGNNRLDITFGESSPAGGQVSTSSSPAGLSTFSANVRGRRTWQVPFRPGSLWHDVRTNTLQILQATTNTWETIMPKA